MRNRGWTRVPALNVIAAASALAALVCCASAAPARSVAAAPPPLAGPAARGAAQRDAQVPLPNKPDTLHFAVIGDNGTGERAQYDVATQLAAAHDRFDFPFVVMMGDNIYGSDRPQDFVKKFESPYKPLLDKGVKFYASLGNHDSREQRYYKLYNMEGKLYYSFKAPKEDVRFFALESTYMDQDELKWTEEELKKSGEKWKIVFFHHPLYSSARTHGSALQLRQVLEPLFIQYGVSVVLTGHDHFYERVKPQKGITYFVCGSGGQLRVGNIDRSTGLTAAGFDTDNAFMVAEIIGDQMTFQAISRTGKIVDAGSLMRRKEAK